MSPKLPPGATPSTDIKLPPGAVLETSPLNEEDLRKERVEEEQKTRDKAETNDDFTEEPVFPDNNYNNEVLAITLDYLGQLREAKTARK